MHATWGPLDDWILDSMAESDHRVRPTALDNTVGYGHLRLAALKLGLCAILCEQASAEKISSKA